MSHANPTVIGGFVIGAITLIVIGLLVFGGINWFAERNTYIAYFPGSVKGLRVGAPVDFRGVTIGEVTEIEVLFNPEGITAQIPVIMQFNPSRIRNIGTKSRAPHEQMIQAGIRAQLQSQSLLTGLLFVNLDFHEDTAVRLVGGEQPYPEIPTIPSDLEQLQESAGDIVQQLPGLVNKLNDILGSVDAGLRTTSGDLREIVGDTADMADRIRAQVPALDRILDNTEVATGELRQAAATLDQILLANREPIGRLIEEWTLTAASMRRTSDQINNLAAENRAGLRDFTEGGLYEYTGLAQDAQRLVDQISRVAEELERDPAGFLLGDRFQGVKAE